MIPAVTNSPTQSETPRELARLAGRAALAKKATDIVVLDMRELTSMCDFFTIATADSAPQLKAVVEAVEKELKSRGAEPWHVEGLENRRWVVLDYVDFVVHVFTPGTRETYILERLWGDAPREVMDDAAGRS